MSWNANAPLDAATWAGICAYADDRIKDLTAVCIAPESPDHVIRQAQAGISELERLKSLPSTIQAVRQIRESASTRKEY